MINPLILLWGTGSFIAALLIHILVWRTLQPTREMAWLIIIFLIFPVLIYITLFIISSLKVDYLECFLGYPFNLIFTLLWHGALSSAYIMTYPPIQAGCPSLKIMLAVSSSLSEGMTSEEINQLFPEDTLFTERIEDLEKEGLITLKYDVWGITFTGRLLSKFFAAYRNLLKLPIGEG